MPVKCSNNHAMRHVVVVILIALCLKDIVAYKACDFGVSRRDAILSGGAFLSSTALITSCPPNAEGARGAAELDLEYYARDLFGGNKKEGNVLPSRPPDLPPPRTIKQQFASSLIDDELSSSCLTIAALLEQRKTTSAGKSEDDVHVLEKQIQDKIIDYRDKAKRSFAARAMWFNEKVTDQYYFDLTSYAVWRAAADIIPIYAQRDKFVRGLGRQLYSSFQSQNLIAGLAATKDGAPSGRLSVAESVSYTQKVLDVFEANGYCKGYRIGDKKDQGGPIFDDLDEEAISDGATLDCLVSIFEPTTLGACLQITGEQSRFIPDYVATTLSAMWEETSDIKCTWELFFVDNVYRPNPKDYFPNEQLIQFTLSRR